MITLSGKKTFGTGGGTVITETLAAEGLDIVISSRRKDVLKQTAAELNRLGKGKVHPVVCDVRSTKSVKNVPGVDSSPKNLKSRRAPERRGTSERHRRRDSVPAQPTAGR